MQPGKTPRPRARHLLAVSCARREPQPRASVESQPRAPEESPTARDQLLTVALAAVRMDVSARRVYEMVSAGKFPVGVVVRLDRQIRFRPAALEKWLESGGTHDA